MTTVSAIVVAIGPAALVGALAVWELWPGEDGTGYSLHEKLRNGLAGLRMSVEEISGNTLKLDASHEEVNATELVAGQPPFDKAPLLHETWETLRLADSDDTVQPGSLEYQLLLNKADQEFRTFKAALFNNSASAWPT